MSETRSLELLYVAQELRWKQKTHDLNILFNISRKEMPQHHQIQVRFIRRRPNGEAETDHSRDDILVISRVGDNSVRLSYTERNADGSVVDIMNYTHHQAISYMYRVLWFLGLDEDPFQSVQFFLPGYPTCLVLVKNVKSIIPQLLESFYSVFQMWPATGVDRTGHERRSVHSLPDHPGIRMLELNQPD